MITTASATSGGILAACIDDSDCRKLGEGSKYACFGYFCYPWKDHSGVAASEKRDLCRRSSDCKRPGQQCQRHQDRRKIKKGLCMSEVTDCDTQADCPGGYGGCCNGYCCEERYFQQYKALPCFTHLGCQELGLGEYCCPDKHGNGTSMCCDTNPTRRIK